MDTTVGKASVKVNALTEAVPGVPKRPNRRLMPPVQCEEGAVVQLVVMATRYPTRGALVKHAGIMSPAETVRSRVLRHMAPEVRVGRSGRCRGGNQHQRSSKGHGDDQLLFHQCSFLSLVEVSEQHRCQAWMRAGAKLM